MNVMNRLIDRRGWRRGGGGLPFRNTAGSSEFGKSSAEFFLLDRTGFDEAPASPKAIPVGSPECERGRAGIVVRPSGAPMGRA